MPDYASIQDKVDRGRGKASDKLGPPYDVYRISGSGDVLASGNRVAQGINVLHRVARGIKPIPETDTRQGVTMYQLVFDASEFKVGDIFVLTDTIFGAGHSQVTFTTEEYQGFCLASHQSIKHCLGFRLNTTIKVLRNEPAPDQNGYWSPTVDNSKPLLCTSGTFALGTVGATSHLIPAGLQAQPRPYGDRAIDDVPSMPRKSLWSCYVPPLKGFIFREGDIIVDALGNRYFVLIAYKQDVGIVGSQLLVEREVSA